MLKSANKNKHKQNALSGVKLLSRDRLSNIHYEIHVLMFPQVHVVTFDCKLYLHQLMISEYLMGVYRDGGGVARQVVEPWYWMSVMTENNGVSEIKQCFSCKFQGF